MGFLGEGEGKEAESLFYVLARRQWLCAKFFMLEFRSRMWSNPRQLASGRCMKCPS